jgi:hypothetical protein
LGGSRCLHRFWVPCLGLDSGFSVLTAVSDVSTRVLEYTISKRGWVTVPPSSWCAPLGALCSTSPPCPALLGPGPEVLSSLTGGRVEGPAPPTKGLEDGLDGPGMFSGPAGVSLAR